MVGLGDLPRSWLEAYAHDANLDGSVIVGHGTTELGWEAFIRDEQNGMRNLESVLASEYGLTLGGWPLIEASAISDDRNVVVGYGTNPLGQTEGWVVYIPEPQLFLMAVTVVLASGLARRRW